MEMTEKKDRDIVSIKQIDLRTLKTPAEFPKAEKQRNAAAFEEIDIMRKDKPDVVFEGKLIARVDSRNFPGAHGGGGKHWTELEIYELRSGEWVACSIACSDKEGQVDFGEVEYLGAKVLGCDDDISISAPISNDPAAQSDPRFWQKRAAMKFWGWSWLAKELAEKAGWDVRERIG